jgi:hypothetical protein
MSFKDRVSELLDMPEHYASRLLGYSDPAVMRRACKEVLGMHHWPFLDRYPVTVILVYLKHGVKVGHCTAAVMFGGF